MPGDDPLDKDTARPVNRLGPLPSGKDAIPEARRNAPAIEHSAEFRQRECYRFGYYAARSDLVVGLSHEEIRAKHMNAAEVVWRGKPHCIEATRDGIEDALAGHPMKPE